MHANPEPAPAAHLPDPVPFARCRYCVGAIGRTEQVVYFSSGKVAHIECYDRSRLSAELADQVGAP